jgi:hypothetical protein
MNYMPPAYVVKVGDSRWGRYVIRDGLLQYWTGEQRWSDKPGDATLFYRHADATATIDRLNLDAGIATKFTVTVVVTAHLLMFDELMDFLQEHSELSLRDPRTDEELRLEIIPDTLKAVDECGED